MVLYQHFDTHVHICKSKKKDWIYRPLDLNSVECTFSIFCLFFLLLFLSLSFNFISKLTTLIFSITFVLFVNLFFLSFYFCVPLFLSLVFANEKYELKILFRKSNICLYFSWKKKRKRICVTPKDTQGEHFNSIRLVGVWTQLSLFSIQLFHCLSDYKEIHIGTQKS